MKILAFNCYVCDFKWECVCGGKEIKINQLQRKIKRSFKGRGLESTIKHMYHESEIQNSVSDKE